MQDQDEKVGRVQAVLLVHDGQELRVRIELIGLIWLVRELVLGGGGRKAYIWMLAEWSDMCMKGEEEDSMDNQNKDRDTSLRGMDTIVMRLGWSVIMSSEI